MNIKAVDMNVKGMDASKTDELLEKFQGGGGLHPKICIADLGPSKHGFSIMKLK